MIYGFMALFAALIVAADQVTKYLVVANIPLYTRVPAIPGLIHWTYVQNTGAAFSSFEGMRWLFVVIFAVFTGLIIWEFSKKRWPLTMFERWCITHRSPAGIARLPGGAGVLPHLAVPHRRQQGHRHPPEGPAGLYSYSGNGAPYSRGLCGPRP